MKCVVLGAGGFIGGHLTRRLRDEGHHAVGIDIKPINLWWQTPAGVQVLPNYDVATQQLRVLQDADEVYCLAADMGGIGFIEQAKLQCMLTIKTSVNALEKAAKFGVGRFFYSSSACVYAAYHQSESDNHGLAEWMAYPAEAEDGYGWEKLFTERLCRHFTEDAGLETRIARYHNIYGPCGTWTGGREKAPAAMCRKVAQAHDGDPISIWGDGLQTRSFTYIEDCLEGTIRIMRSDCREPINLGSDEMVSINQLATMVETIAGKNLRRVYEPSAPKGVRGRNSDNTLIRRTLGWEPSIKLYDGLTTTYAWVKDQIDHDYA